MDFTNDYRGPHSYCHFNSVIAFALIGHVRVNNTLKHLKMKHKHNKYYWIDDQSEVNAIS